MHRGKGESERQTDRQTDSEQRTYIGGSACVVAHISQESVSWWFRCAGGEHRACRPCSHMCVHVHVAHQNRSGERGGSEGDGRRRRKRRREEEEEDAEEEEEEEEAPIPTSAQLQLVDCDVG